jgi:hypothetical protein
MKALFNLNREKFELKFEGIKPDFRINRPGLKAGYRIFLKKSVVG